MPSITLTKENKSIVVQTVTLATPVTDPKNSCRVATTVNIALTGLQTIDGVVLVAGDRVLVKNQASAAQNGIYVAATTAWARALDADSDADVTPGMTVIAEEGVTQAESFWILATNAPIVLGTTGLSFKALTGVENFATQTALLAAIRPDGNIGYAEDTDQHYVRQAGAWQLILVGTRYDLAVQEDLTIAVTGAGVDPVVPAQYTTQAEFTARGPFATIPAAVAAIPSNVGKYRVAITLPDGDTALDEAAGFLGDLSRFHFSVDPLYDTPNFVEFFGSIRFKSANGLVRVSGTVALDVAAGANEGVTLDADPGFAANLYAGFFLRVVSGAGAGQVTTIRSHTGTGFVIGRMASNLDATSVVEVVKPAARLVLTNGGPTFNVFNIACPLTPAAPGGGVAFDAIDLYSAAADFPTFEFSGGLILDGGARVLGVSLFGGYQSQLGLGLCVIDGQGKTLPNLVIAGMVRSISTITPWLLRNAVGLQPAAIMARNDGVQSEPRAMFLFRGAIDSIGGHAIFLSGRLAAGYLGLDLRASGITGFGLVISRGAGASVELATVQADGGLTGAAGDFSLDGTTKTWADLAVSPLDTMSGGQTSVVIGT
jgi:hypothetical protein